MRRAPGYDGLIAIQVDSAAPQPRAITFQLEAEGCTAAPQQLLATSSREIALRWSLASAIPSSRVAI
jgi:hypothetical protein